MGLCGPNRTARGANFHHVCTYNIKKDTSTADLLPQGTAEAAGGEPFGAAAQRARQDAEARHRQRVPGRFLYLGVHRGALQHNSAWGQEADAFRPDSWWPWDGSDALGACWHGCFR